jgi:DNA-binding LacI/PurR family transcriptional regulator
MKTFDHAIHMLLCNTNYDPMRTAASVRKRIENKVRGVAVMTSEWGTTLARDLVAH